MAGERLGVWSLCVKPLPGERLPWRVRGLGDVYKSQLAVHALHLDDLLPRVS